MKWKREKWWVTDSIDDSPFDIGGGKRNGVSQKILPLFPLKGKGGQR